MKAATWHALCLLRMGARRPLVWAGVLALPWVAGMLASLTRALPQGAVFILGVSSGGVGILLLAWGLGRPTGRLQNFEPSLAQPNLPLSPRTRAMAEGAAALVALLPGILLAAAIMPLLDLPVPGEPAYEALPFQALSLRQLLCLALVFLPGVVSHALAAREGVFSGGLVSLLVAACLAIGWSTGLLRRPEELALGAIAFAALLVALGQAPTWKPRHQLQRPLRVAPRAGLQAGARFLRDLSTGLLVAHLIALPEGLITAAGIRLLRQELSGLGDWPELIAASLGVALIAALHPLALQTRHGGRRSAWRTLPMSESRLAAGLLVHAVISLTVLPAACLIALLPLSPLLILGMVAPIALALAGTSTALQLRGPGRALVGLALSLGISRLVMTALAAEEPWGLLVGTCALAVVMAAGLLGDVVVPGRMREATAR